jgi:ferric-dicitrate binding protein FerR (iron transport regulator)
VRHSDEDIEFAGRILADRDRLDDGEVGRWLESADNCALLDRLAAVRRASQRVDFSRDKSVVRRRLTSLIAPRRTFRRWAAASAAVVFLVAGLAMWLRWSGTPDAGDATTAAIIKPPAARAELVLSLDAAAGSAERLAETLAEGRDDLDVSTASGTSGLNVLRTPVGGFYRWTLADGTRVWLNSESELSFPTAFEGGRREVTVSGEACFEVARDERRPFVVHAAGASVTVLGTKFNLSAWGDEGQVVATLVEGSIALRGGPAADPVLLGAGDQAAMDRTTGAVTTRRVDAADHIAWVEGKYVFDDLPLDRIMRRLQRWYGFSVVYADPSIGALKLRGMVDRDMEIETVLDIVGETTGIRYSIDGTVITLGK